MKKMFLLALVLGSLIAITGCCTDCGPGNNCNNCTDRAK